MLMEIPYAVVTVMTLLAPIDPASDSVVSVTEPAPEPVSGPSLLQGAAGEKKKLTGAVNAGVSSSFGNTEITNINLNANATYEVDEVAKFSGLFDWLYSRQKDMTTNVTTTSQRRVRGALQYDHRFHKKLYGFLRTDAMGDGVQDLELRLILSAGLGYQVIDTDEEKLAVEGGLAWTHEDYKAVSPDEYLALRLAGKYFKQVTEELKFDASLEWLPSLEDSDDQVVFGMAQLGYNLGAGLVTSLRYEFDYDNTPPAGNDRIDHRIIWGLGYTF